MKVLMFMGALSVLSAHAQMKVIDNWDAARSKVTNSPLTRISTNTPAFEHYAVELMMATANETRVKWKLDIPRQLTINDIWFEAVPVTRAFNGFVQTRDGRYVWSFSDSRFRIFQDHKYWPRSFRYKDDESARLTKIKSRIDAKEAERIACDTLAQLGYTNKELGLKGAAIVNQYKFEETNGVVYPLPCFNVAWDIVDWPDEDGPAVRIDVSGITQRIAQYENFGHVRRWPLPTNYLEMLNLPTNYFDSITSPVTRAVWGLPQLTNQPPR